MILIANSNFFKRIDSCLDNKCNNASKYYGNSILIEFQNIYPYETHYNIAEINIEAQRIDNIVDYINPQDSVINSNQQFDITFNYDVQITNTQSGTPKFIIKGTSLKNLKLTKPKFQYDVDIVGNFYEIKLISENLIKNLFIDSNSEYNFSDNYFDLLPNKEKIIRINRDDFSSASSFEESLRFTSLYDTY